MTGFKVFARLPRKGAVFEFADTGGGGGGGRRVELCDSEGCEGEGGEEGDETHFLMAYEVVLMGER